MASRLTDWSHDTVSTVHLASAVPYTGTVVMRGCDPHRMTAGDWAKTVTAMKNAKKNRVIRFVIPPAI